MVKRRYTIEIGAVKSALSLLPVMPVTAIDIVDLVRIGIHLSFVLRSIHLPNTCTSGSI